MINKIKRSLGISPSFATKNLTFFLRSKGLLHKQSVALGVLASVGLLCWAHAPSFAHSLGGWMVWSCGFFVSFGGFGGFIFCFLWDLVVSEKDSGLFCCFLSHVVLVWLGFLCFKKGCWVVAVSFLSWGPVCSSCFLGDGGEECKFRYIVVWPNMEDLPPGKKNVRLSSYLRQGFLFAILRLQLNKSSGLKAFSRTGGHQFFFGWFPHVFWSAIALPSNI